jgi:crotonobetainyl-CoA:carnitine CoA-transferase CaiB-like acyl-CoA transferase
MFSDLKIIDLSTVLAGPSVGMFFAELGSEVVKIENPSIPDVTRTWKLASEDPNTSVSAYFSSINYKKKYEKLDLKKEADQLSLKKLIENADILLSNFKKGDDVKFGLTDEVLLQLNPKLIHGKISGFGLESDRVAYDLILQAETGFMSMNGTKDSGPIKMPVALIDVLAAHQLKEGILASLYERTFTQKGKIVHVSLYHAAVCSLINQASAYLMEKHVAKPIGSLHPSIAPYGELFKTNDGALITFAIGSQQQFNKLCHYLGVEEILEDGKFGSNQQRVIHRKELQVILQNRIDMLHANAVLAWAEENTVPCGKVKTLDEVLNASNIQELIKTETIENQETKRITSIAFERW